MIVFASIIVVAATMLVVGTEGDGRSENRPYTRPDSLPPGVTLAMVTRGYEAFHGDGLCVNCHGVAARGLVGPDLADSEWWHAAGSYLSIIRIVMTGIPEARSLSGTEMPPRGGSEIDDSDVIAVAAFVWRISHPDEDAFPLGVTPQIVEMGNDVFHNKADCVDCHGEDATGDEGPNLTDANWLHARGSYLAIANQIMKGVPYERSRSGIIMPPRGGSTLSDADVHAVAAYVWVISRISE